MGSGDVYKRQTKTFAISQKLNIRWTSGHYMLNLKPTKGKSMHRGYIQDFPGITTTCKHCQKTGWEILFHNKVLDNPVLSWDLNDCLTIWSVQR